MVLLKRSEPTHTENLPENTKEDSAETLDFDTVVTPYVYNLVSACELVMNGKRVGLYLRVSTDDQTVENQRDALVSACKARGWRIVEEFVDEGISGAKGREKRPGFDKLCKAATRRQIDVVAAWSVDRLGRSLQDLVGFLSELNSVGCDLYLDRQAVDTTTPAGRALFQMLGVFAEFERSIIVERVRAGMARAKRRGTKSGRPIGRPETANSKLREIKEELAKGTGVLKVARTLGVGTSVVQRVKRAEGL